jgi:origin recognition complex subunit 1
MRNPKDAYVALWKAVSGESLGVKAALARLQGFFSDTTSSKSGSRLSSSKADSEEPIPTTICLVDEIDFLMIKSDEILYHLFEWPQSTASKGRLIVIGVANMMDLPDHFSSRVSSRLKSGLDRMVFAAYTYEHINQILATRLGDLNIFDARTMELVARKAANMTGDLRTALKVCQRSIEIFRTSLSLEDRKKVTTLCISSYIDIIKMSILHNFKSGDETSADGKH